MRISLIRAFVLAATVSGSTLTAQAPKASPTKPAPQQQPTPAATKVVDINTASAAELEAMPGIGKAFAAKIIGGRPYANKRQLVQKKILSQVLYDRIKDQIIAKQ